MSLLTGNAGQIILSPNSGLATTGTTAPNPPMEDYGAQVTMRPTYATFSASYDPPEEITLSWRNLSDTGAGPQPGEEGSGGNGFWKVESSEYAGIPVGTPFEKLTSLINAILPLGNCVINLPPGEYDPSGTISYDNDVFARKIIFVGAVDGSDQPDTFFEGGANLNSTQENALLELRNIGFGVLPSNDTGSEQVSAQTTLGFLGHLILRNFIIRGAKNKNGISSSRFVGSLSDWDRKTKRTIGLFDGQIYRSGAGSTQHNIYCHDLLKLHMERVYSHSTQGAHCLKVDGCNVVALDCYVEWNDGVQPTTNDSSAIVNVNDRLTDNYWRRCVLDWKHDGTSGTAGKRALQITSRRNQLGGASTKVPPRFEAGPELGFEPADQRWGTLDMDASDITGFESAANHSAGTTAIAVRREGAILKNNDPAADLSDTSNNFYRVQLLLDNDVVHETTATSNGSGELTLSAAIPTGRTWNTNSKGMAWEDGSTPLLPNLSSKFYNKHDPDYIWPKMTTDGSTLDFDKQDFFHTHYFEDCFAVADITASQGEAVVPYENFGLSYWSKNTASMLLPFPPLNRPLGATVDWPDGSGGSGTVPADWNNKIGTNGQAASFPILADFPSGGDGTSGSDFIYPAMVVMKDFGTYKVSGTLYDINNGRFDSGPPESIEHNPNARYLNSGGSIVSFNEGQDNISLPTRREFTLTAAAAKDATVISINSATNITTGMRLHLLIDGPQGTGKQLFPTTVANKSGNDLTLDNALPYAVSNGARGSAFVGAGSNPANWRMVRRYESEHITF